MIYSAFSKPTLNSVILLVVIWPNRRAYDYQKQTAVLNALIAILGSKYKPACCHLLQRHIFLQVPLRGKEKVSIKDK